jgi:hypothetical protein
MRESGAGNRVFEDGSNDRGLVIVTRRTTHSDEVLVIDAPRLQQMVQIQISSV